MRIPSFVLLAALLGAAARLLHGAGAPHFDPLYALIWGRELTGWDLPDVEVPGAPTPHPGSIALAALATPLGTDGGRDALVAISFGALGAAAVAVGLETRTLAGRAAAVLAAVLILLAAGPAIAAREGLTDLVYVSLVAWAVVLAIRDERAVRPPLVLLAFAGCLRPEAWLFSVAYVLWRGRGDALAWALTAAGPLIWVTFDLVLTGDPLFSGNSTELGGRPTGLGAALEGAPAGVRELLGPLLAAAGLAGMLAITYYRPSLAPVAVGAPLLAVAAFVGLGIAEQPAIQRYLLLFAVLLVPLAAAAAFGWSQLEPSDPARRWWRPAGIALAVALVAVSLVDLRDAEPTDARLPVERDLEKLLEDSQVHEAIADCPPLQVEEDVYLPLARWLLDAPPEEVTGFDPGEPEPGVIVLRTSEPTAGAHPIGQSEHWRAVALDCPDGLRSAPK